MIFPSSFFNSMEHHYKISQFYRRKYSVGVWLAVRLQRRITSVGFPFIGDSPFRRYIGQKNKKTICRWFYRRNLCAKKKTVPALTIPTDFHPSVISWLTDGYIPSVNFSVSVWNTDQIYMSVKSSVIVSNADGFSLSVNLSVSVWNTDRIYPSVNASMNAIIKYRRINSVDNISFF
jgi:hypothetical protein